MSIEVAPGTESVHELRKPYPYSHVFRMIYLIAIAIYSSIIKVRD